VQAFLTGTLQNFARKNALPIDTVSFGFQVMDELGSGSSCSSGPEDGCYIRGLFLEGARWDGQQRQLGESESIALDYAASSDWEGDVATSQ
jgi:dynein heavy chain